MLSLKEIVGIRALRQTLYFKPGFLTHFALGTLLNRLTKLQVATRKSPRARAMRALAQAQEHEAFAKNDDSYTDTGTRLDHLT